MSLLYITFIEYLDIQNDKLSIEICKVVFAFGNVFCVFLSALELKVNICILECVNMKQLDTSTNIDLLWPCI